MPGTPAVTKEVILEALKDVYDPDLGRSIVDLEFVKNIEISEGKIRFDVELTTPACPIKEHLRMACLQKVQAIPGVKSVDINMTAAVRAGGVAREGILEGVKNAVAVASGKGGVGKSTAAANLALALREMGGTVGLLDADVYGPSVGVMFGTTARPGQANGKLLPVEAHGIKLMSMAFLSDESTPVVWRGPMVHGLILQLLTLVDWGGLDYLVIDLPPGTGDAVLTLTQTAPLAGAVIITTPQDVSLVDARKGLRMFQEVRVPVLGIVENMSYFVCGHCHERTEIFGHGGGRATATQLGVPFLGEVPIDPEVVIGGDQGIPIMVSKPESPVAAAYREIAKQLAAQIAVRSMGGSSAPPVELRWEKRPES